MACPKFSAADKEYIAAQRDNPRVNAIMATDEATAIANEYGYANEEQDYEEEEQVSSPPPSTTTRTIKSLPAEQTCHNHTDSRSTSWTSPAQCNFI